MVRPATQPTTISRPFSGGVGVPGPLLPGLTLPGLPVAGLPVVVDAPGPPQAAPPIPPAPRRRRSPRNASALWAPVCAMPWGSGAGRSGSG